MSLNSGRVAARTLRQWFKRAGKRTADIQARILLTLFYFIVLGPFALVLRWGSDPLAIKRSVPQRWHDREDRKESRMEWAAKQF